MQRLSLFDIQPKVNPKIELSELFEAYFDCRSNKRNTVNALTNFLLSTLQLNLHPRKVYLQHYSKGVKFLGVVIKPHRIYIANRTKGNFYEAIERQNEIARDHKPTKDEQEKFLSSMNSYLSLS
ncbi:MAG: hypothetical protein ABIF11_02400 [Nitrospirota bacterium]